MKLDLLTDPRAALAKFTELRERVAALRDQVGPELQKFACTYDLPFSTLNRLLEYGEKLLQKAVAVQQTIEAFAEIMNGVDDSKEKT
jgi:hypothetical protein